MCGIAGQFNFNQEPVDRSLLERMTGEIERRGPDDFGHFFFENVGLGFRRLSIIDIEHGHQPMVSDCGRYVLVFNGEIYNYIELQKIMSEKGIVFKTSSDTEVLLRAFILWGEKCLDRLNGMFAFSVFDKKEGLLFVARDRLGIKPLYFYRDRKRFIFGSEPKVILANPEFERIPDLESVSSYLTFRYPQRNKSFFKGMEKLPPGHFLWVGKDKFDIQQYWEIPLHKQKADLGEKYYLEKIEKLLRNSVKIRMRSDVPLGALLSGGLDSSLIVSMMRQLSNKPVSTYSIGFDSQGYDESSFAQIVADYCGTKHTYIELSQKDYLNELVESVRLKDAPLSIPHEVALFQICKELKKYTTVVISGEGADELFGGYGRVQRSPMDYKKIRVVKSIKNRALRKAALSFLGAGDFADEWSDVSHHSEHFFSVYNWIPFKEKWSLLNQSTLDEIRYDQNDITSWKEDFSYIDGADDYDKILYLFEKRHLVCLLDRLDVMSMAAGVEARVPFVDHNLVEFVSSIPIKHKLKWNSLGDKCRSLFTNSFEASEVLDQSKYILRKLSEKYLPHEISYRKKKGFPVPLDSWIKGGMRESAKEILLDQRSFSRGVFNLDEVEKLLNEEQNLKYDFWGKKIWMLMNVELWFREFID